MENAVMAADTESTPFLGQVLRFTGDIARW